MATQADWPMMLGIRQQPNQWAEALSNLPGNLMQGMQIGDYFRERGRESQLQELMRGAIDPQTGGVDQGKMLQAIIQTYPEKAPALAAEMRKQYQYEQSQQALQQFMTGSGAGAGAGGLATPPSVQALTVAGAGGQPEKALENLAGFENQWALAERNRRQQFIQGLDEYNRPVTRTVGQWEAGTAPQTPVGAPSATGPQTPVGAPSATGEARIAMPPAISLTNPSVGAVGGDIPLEMIRNLPPADREKLYSQLTPGQVANINLALGEPGTVSAQTPFAPPQQNKAAPGVPGIPGGPAPVGTAPVSGIRTGLSEEEKQAFKIQEERRAEQRRIEEERRAEQRRIEEEGRAVQNKIAEEIRSLRNKGLSTGDQAWVDNVLAPGLKEYQQNSFILGDLTTMERLNKEGKTGPGSEFQLTLKRGLVAAGMLDPKAVATEQQIIAMSNALTWNTLAQQKGPQTDVDFARMQATWPNILNAGDANQFLIDSKKAILSRRQQQIEFYRNNFQDAVKAGNVLGLEDAWAKTPAAQKSIWDEPIMRKWSLKYPMPGQQQEESQSGELKFNHPQQDEVDKIKAQLLRDRR